MPQPEISAITPYNGSGTIGALIRSLANQCLDAARYELLIGCEAGVEPSPNELRSVPFEARVVHALPPAAKEFHTAARLRNAAIREARGERLVFIDSDCIASPKCLDRHAAAGGQTAVCGVKLEVVHPAELSGAADTLFETLSVGACPDERLTHRPQPGRCGCWGFWTCNASAPTHLVKAAGLFDERGFRCHDLDLAYRLQVGGARFLLDPECQVIHIEHGRSIWLTRARIAGLTWLAKKHPEAAAGAENLLAVFHELFHNNLLEAEEKFAKLTRSLPGVRAGLAWVMPCGYPLSRVAASLHGLQTIVRRRKHGVQIFLRLAGQCWDYSIILPEAGIPDHPLFSVVVLPSSDEVGIANTVESLLSQTCQSFELVVTATAPHAARLRPALGFSACERMKIRLAPPDASRAEIIEQVTPFCRGDFLVQIEAGGWLREGLLGEIANCISRRNGDGAGMRHGADWSVSEDGQEPQRFGNAVDPGNGAIRVSRMPREETGPALLALPTLPATGGDFGDSAQDCMSTPDRTNGRAAALCAFTFDSGPHPELTRHVLEALGEFGMKASFFLLGSQIRRCPDVVRQILAAGHEVGLQGYYFEDLSNSTYSTIAASIAQTASLVSDLAGVRPRWFRPPLARCSALIREVCRMNGLTPVGWHVSSGDWTGQHHHRTVATVLAHGLEGAVVQFHDACGDPCETAQAVRALGRIACANGIRGARLSDLASHVPLPTL